MSQHNETDRQRTASITCDKITKRHVSHRYINIACQNITKRHVSHRNYTHNEETPIAPYL